jgi:hypothetical protein
MGSCDKGYARPAAVLELHSRATMRSSAMSWRPLWSVASMPILHGKHALQPTPVRDPVVRREALSVDLSVGCIRTDALLLP